MLRWHVRRPGPASRAGLPKMRTPVFTVLLLVVVALSSGASLAQPSAPGGTLVCATFADCTTFNPYLAADLNSWQLASVLYDPLLRYDDALEPRACLAESWSMAPDGKSWTFELRRGVRFHDGVELTAADVEFTLDMLRDPKTRVARRTCIDEMQSDPGNPARVRFEKKGKYGFTVHFNRPAAWAIEDWTSLPILPRHLLEGKDVNNDPFNTSRPIGTGPFRLLESRPGASLLFGAFDGHWAGRPKLDRLEVRIIPDDHERLAALRRGEVDHAVLPGPLLQSALDDTLRRRFSVFTWTEPSFFYVGWQCDPERTRFFNDERVRQAMGLAIDTDRLARVILGGMAVKADSCFAPGSWAAASPATAPVRCDPAQAVSILNSAGWYDTDGDGTLDRVGERLAFQLDAPAGSTIVRRVVPAITEDLRKLGIDARPRYTEWPQFASERIQKRDFEAILLAWYLPVEPDPYPVFHSGSVPCDANPRGLNRTGFSSRRADESIEAARAATERPRQLEALQTLRQVLRDEAPYTLLYHPRIYGLVSNRIRVERPGAVPREDPALRLPAREVSRWGLLTPDFLRLSSVEPSAATSGAAPR